MPFTADAGQTVTVTDLTGANPRRRRHHESEGVLELAVAPGVAPNSVDVQTPGDGTRTLLRVHRCDDQDAAVRRRQSAVVAARARAVVRLPDRHASQLRDAGRAARRPSSIAGPPERALVSIDDVYDEFSFGARSPQALKDFLARARATWTVPPRYVVLAGDATFDPRDYAAFGFGDFVPTGFVDMAEMELETASDDWFVDGNSDGVPDLAIGRLPVRTPVQASAIVGKIISYDAEAAGTWAKGVALVTDTDDPTVRFRASSAALATRVPASFQINRLDRDVLGAPALRNGLFGLVNQGQLIVNYLGHGSTYIWGQSGELLGTADMPANWTPTGSRLPFVVAMNCLNGFFQGIDGEESLAETLLRRRRRRRGVGVLEPHRSGAAGRHERRAVPAGVPLARRRSAMPCRPRRVRTGSSDVRRSWMFFGDPAMRLKGLPMSSGGACRHSRRRRPL